MKRLAAPSASHDPRRAVFVLKCWTHERIPNRWRAQVLSFAHVLECDVVLKEAVSYYEVATLRYRQESEALLIVAHYGIDIALKVRSLEGTLTSTEEFRDH